MYYGGTSNLSTHLKKAQPSAWPTADNAEVEDKTPAEAKLVKFFYVTGKSQRICSNAKSKAITNLVIDWILKNSQLISIVGDTGLK